MKELRELKVGILGGGQLGRMLAQASIPLNIHLEILDPDPQAPSSKYCQKHTVGSFRDHRDVLNFGKSLDILTVEIEEVSVEALEELEELGCKVFPQSSVLQIIRDKGLQKQFYVDNHIPTMPFKLFQSASEVLKSIESGSISVPFVQKSRRAGYDGQGVRVIKSKSDLENLLDTPCVIEEMCSLQTEISVLVARNQKGEVKSWDPVEMVFNEKANLIDSLCYPARLSQEILQNATSLALTVAQKFEIVGILAVELFLDKSNNLIVNECAPRPHNSGHQTIESSTTSQYEQHLRAVTGLPLGNTDIKIPSVMINLVGEEGHSGPAKFIGLNEILSLPGVKLHDYGKSETRPFRKMGHITITDSQISLALERARLVKSIVKVIA